MKPSVLNSSGRFKIPLAVGLPILDFYARSMSSCRLREFIFASSQGGDVNVKCLRSGFGTD